jgi:Xaa-Pro aminopeptidase
MNLETIQSALRDQHLDGWLFYDHHHRDPIAYRILGLPDSFVSRRWYYFVPAHGEPRKIVHRIESGKLETLPGTTLQYSSWQELEKNLSEVLEGYTKIAMQYSPRNAIMYVSMVDAGTIELLRSLNKDIVTSADLVSLFEAVLTEDQIATHYAAQERIDRVLAGGWKYITDHTRDGDRTTEFEVVTFLRKAMAREGMFTDHGPNCSVGPNSADSHYEPSESLSSPIFRGDFVLIDIFAKLANRPDSVWYDITWTGVVGRQPTDREQHIFATVRDARDAAIATIEQAYSANRPIAGWQGDDAARNVIRRAGLDEFFTHRTGHNISTEIHGNGAHLDNLETHDERLLLPNTCFSVEPGIYFPGEFGVRSEVDMITRPGKAVVTGPRQTELLRI